MPEARVIPLDGGRGEGPAARRRKARGRRPSPSPPIELPVEEPAESPDWERKLAGGLAFLRRRITGDYPVDEFGFDADLTDHVALPLLRPLYEKYFRVEVRGMENVPSEGGALIVANHSGTVPVDAVMTQLALHDHHPGAPAPAAARRRPGLHDADRRAAGAQGRHDAGLQRRRRAAAELRRAGRGLAGGLQGHRQAVQRALQAAALRPRRVRVGGAAHRRADHPVLDRRRRGDLPDGRQHPDAGPAARRALHPDHAVLPVARAARPAAAAVEVDHRVRRADRDRQDRRRPPPTTRCWSST